MCFKEIALVKKDLESKGYNVIGIGLYGSQNYNMNDEQSDIDMRAVVLPTLEQVINRTKISKKYITPYGDVDVKDLLTYYEVVRKGNFSFIEPFQSEWYIGDKELQNMFGNIKLNWKSVIGAMYEKKKAFKHKYPSKEEEFKKWGFDPKQMHHILRLGYLLEQYDDSVSFIKYEEGMKDFLLDIKRNECNIIEENMLDNDIEVDRFIQKHREMIPTDYVYEQVDLSKEINNMIINAIKLEIGNTKITSARQYRTFGGAIPKADIKKFPELEEYKGEDISYIVYESLEIL